MITYPPALRQTGFVAPKAVGRFGLAIMEARAAEGPRNVTPSRTPPAEVIELPPPKRTVIRLWLPLTVLFLLLAPFALLLSPLLYLAPRRVVPSPFATVAAVGRMLLSLSGTDIDVDTPEAVIRLRIV